MTDFDPKVAEFVQTGATATLILDAVRLFSGECVELCLKQIDTLVLQSAMTPELALGLVSEIAAYRRIVTRIKAKATLREKIDGRTTPP